MPRAPTISYERFKEVATSLKNEGQDLTYRLLRERLGGGSYEVLNRYIELFNKELAAGMPGMPTNILSGAHALYEQAKSDVRRELAQEHAQRIEELDSEHASLQAERERLVVQAARSQGAAEVLSEQLRSLERDLSGARQENDDLVARLAGRELELSHARAAYATAEALWVEQRDALRSEAAKASERADKAERRFLLEMDHLRQAMRQFETFRMQEVDALTKQLAEARAQYVKASADIARREAHCQAMTDVEQLAAGLRSSVEGAVTSFSGKLDTVVQACEHASGRDQSELAASIVARLQEMSLDLQLNTPAGKRAGKEHKT